MKAEIIKTARLNAARTHRLELLRLWNADRNLCVFIGLNPSTADENEDDPTIRRCIRFADDWGYGGLLMLNLFSFRSTDPAGLRGHVPDEEQNLDTLYKYIESKYTGIVVAAWGTHAKVWGRNLLSDIHAKFPEHRKKLHHLGTTKDGHPKHPLYLRADTKPVPFWYGEHHES